MKDIKYKEYCFDRLTHGSRLSIEDSIYIENKEDYMSDLFALGKDELVRLLEESQKEEENIVKDFLIPAFKEWEKVGAKTQAYKEALEVHKVGEVEHTNNQWKPKDYSDYAETISNRVYLMSVEIWEDTKWNREEKKSIPVAWYATWRVVINTPIGGMRLVIDGQDRKRYTDKEKAFKYIEGRKKKYAHLFTEVSPKIPLQYANRFTLNGMLLPGYELEKEQ